MSHGITIEQIKERLVPIMQKMYPNQPLIPGEDRKRWEEIYSPLYSLFLDICVADAVDSRPIRDMHFLSFSALLWKEIDQAMHVDYEGENKHEGFLFTVHRLIARRAYDFACHVASNVSEKDAAERDAELTTTEAIVRELPDLERWPEETKA